MRPDCSILIRKVKKGEIMLQMNTKEMKNFRDTIAKWHIADFDCKDERITKATVIKSYTGLIETNETRIKKLSGPENETKRKDLRAEIKTFEQAIQSEKDRVKAHVDAQAKNFEAGRALVTDALVEAFEAYLDDIYDDGKETALLEAIVKFFTDNGAKGVTVDDVKKYIRPIGRKGASARQSCLTGKHTTRDKGNKLKDAFLGALCDDPAFIALLPVYSWTNKIEKKAKKQDK